MIHSSTHINLNVVNNHTVLTVRQIRNQIFFEAQGFLEKNVKFIMLSVK